MGGVILTGNHEQTWPYRETPKCGMSPADEELAAWTAMNDAP